MRLRAKLVIVSIPVILVNAPLALIAARHKPIGSGTSARFWKLACGVELGAYERRQLYSREEGIYPPTDGWLVYYVQMAHERRLYRLKPEAAAADIPEVVGKLARDVAEGRPGSKASNACRERLAKGNDDSHDVKGLARAVLEARRTDSHLDPRTASYLTPGAEKGFHDQWDRAGRVWLNYVFESLWLTGWILFAAWPWFRRASPPHWALHWALWPLLLYLPYFLGYAPWTFTIAPPGGFVYPIVIVLFSLPISVVPGTSLDAAILNSLPRALWPISQDPNPDSWTSFGFVGPVGVALYGLVLSGIAYFARVRIDRRAARRAARVGTGDQLTGL